MNICTQCFFHRIPAVNFVLYRVIQSSVMKKLPPLWTLLIFFFFPKNTKRLNQKTQENILQLVLKESFLENEKPWYHWDQPFKGSETLPQPPQLLQKFIWYSAAFPVWLIHTSLVGDLSSLWTDRALSMKTPEYRSSTAIFVSSISPSSESCHVMHQLIFFFPVWFDFVGCCKISVALSMFLAGQDSPEPNYTTHAVFF